MKVQVNCICTRHRVLNAKPWSACFVSLSDVRRRCIQGAFQVFARRRLECAEGYDVHRVTGKVDVSVEIQSNRYGRKPDLVSFRRKSRQPRLTSAGSRHHHRVPDYKLTTMSWATCRSRRSLQGDESIHGAILTLVVRHDVKLLSSPFKRIHETLGDGFFDETDVEVHGYRPPRRRRL